MTETTNYSLSVITHKEAKVTSSKSGDRFSWIAYIKEEDGLFEVTVSIVRLDTGDLGVKSRERIFQNREDAVKYILSTTRNFENFEFKILSTKEKYDQESLEKIIIEWFNYGV